MIQSWRGVWKHSDNPVLSAPGYRVSIANTYMLGFRLRAERVIAVK